MWNEIEKINADIEVELGLSNSEEMDAPREDAIDVTATEVVPFAPRSITGFAPRANAGAAFSAITQQRASRSASRSDSRSWARKIVLACIICTLGTASFGFAFGAAVTWLNERNRNNAAELHAAENNAGSDITSARYVFEPLPDGAVATLADMIDLVAPSVVALTTFTVPEDVAHMMRPPAPRRDGTGIIFAEEAERVFIATSLYVVQNGSQVIVRMSCGARVQARPFASDQDLNISIIYVYRSELADAGVVQIVLATFGDSSAMRMGDTVIAMGNARGEGVSVTRGVISTEEHIIQVPARTARRYLDLYNLQTDASINTGDSGGALVNARGEVVGIIDASINLFGANAQAEGISHSLSSNMVVPALHELVNHLRPAIGIEGRDLSEMPHVAAELGIPEMGVYIARVMANGAAEQAGIQVSDVVTSFNGSPVLDMQQLRVDISQLRPGDVVEMRIIRRGEPLVIYVELLAMVFDRF